MNSSDEKAALIKVVKVADQLSLFRPARRRGGARAGAGRKPGPRPLVPHRARPVHRARHPVHVTLRARGGLPSFREQALFTAMNEAIAAATKSRTDFRVLHFSVQTNHVHFVVEAHDARALSRGMLGLNVRLARGLNRVLRARGRVWGERYHAHPLKTPREVRNALVYVLMNAKKHGVRLAGLDRFSSAQWFDGFADVRPSSSRRPTAEAKTWLADVGWRMRGLIRLDERPVSAPRGRA